MRGKSNCHLKLETIHPPARDYLLSTDVFYYCGCGGLMLGLVDTAGGLNDLGDG